MVGVQENFDLTRWLLIPRCSRIARPWLYQGSARDYKAVRFRIGIEFLASTRDTPLERQCSVKFISRSATGINGEYEGSIGNRLL